MTRFHIRIDHDPQPSDIEPIHQGLVQYNREHSSIADGRRLAILLQDERDGVAGGAVAWIWGACMEIEYLWLDEAARGQGHGQAVLHTLEREAANAGCRTVVLDTYSFQAPEFYLQAGYEIIGIADGYPQNVRKIFMKKTLA